MEKIAINIVLLPDEKMVEEIIEINKELLKFNKNKIILGKEINQPHISLCMGGVNQLELPEIIEHIDKVSERFSQFNFQGKLSIQTTPDLEKILWLEIEKNKEIQKIHEVVMEDLFQYLSYNIKNSMLVDPENVEEKTISWIKEYSNFYRNPQLFNPHVTIGFGDTVKSDSIYNFASSKLAIFKLGNNCTCTELIYSTNLN